jgi:hypothetical protein
LPSSCTPPIQIQICHHHKSSTSPSLNLQTQPNLSQQTSQTRALLHQFKITITTNSSLFLTHQPKNHRGLLLQTTQAINQSPKQNPNTTTTPPLP